MRVTYRIDGGRVVNPGAFRHRIIWQEKAITGQDSFGQDIYSWRDVVSCSAQVRELQGRELQSAQQRWAEAKYMIQQHYDARPRVAHRIAWFNRSTWLYLDPIDIPDQAGTGLVLDIAAKEWIP